MWDLLAEYGLFLAKTLTVVAAILVVIAGLVSASGRARSQEEGHIEVRKLNDRFRGMRDALRSVVMDAKELKRERKAERKAEKAKKKKPADSRGHPRRVYVLNFHGDIRAQAVSALREEISAVLTVADASDEVVVRVESGGGLVHSYGLAASQLARLRERKVPLTVCVDKVAASGGYLMACVADKLVAAPFAMVGSIGVVAQIPNFNRLLRKHAVDVEMLTAGQYKRTLTVLGQNTEAGRQKFIEELEDTHRLFKEFVGRFRPSLDIQEVSTGETWFGERALEKHLIDEIGTSDAYLQTAAESADILEVRYVERKRLPQKLGLAVEGAAARGVRGFLDRLRYRDDPFI